MNAAYCEFTSSFFKTKHGNSEEFEVKVGVIEIIDIECGLLSRVSQKIVATKWRIYKGKINSHQDFCAKANGNF